jgi:hypothetical protein
LLGRLGVLAMVRPPLLLSMLVLIVPTVGIWLSAGRVYNAAHVLAPEVAQVSTFIEYR